MRTLRRTSAGFTLIETVIAVVLLSLFALGIGAFLREQQTRGTEVVNRQTALNLAQSQLERIRAVGPLGYNYGIDLSGPVVADTTPGQDLREVFFRDRFFLDGEGLVRSDTATRATPYEVVVEGRVQCLGGPITEETPVSLFAWRTFDRASGVLRSCAELATLQKPIVSYRVLVGDGAEAPTLGVSTLPSLEVGLQFTERDLLGALCFGGQVWDAGSGTCACPAGQTFAAGRCSCPTGQVWDGSGCVTSTCVISPPRDVIQQPLTHASVVAADPSVPTGAHYYQEMRPDWCESGNSVPTESDWGRFSGGTFVSGGLIPSALNFPTRTVAGRTHVNPTAPFSHWNYACSFGTDFDPTFGVCGCSGALQVTPPGATMSLTRQSSGGWVSTGSSATALACPGPSANAGADPSDGTRTRTFNYNQTCSATATPGVYTDLGLQTTQSDGPCTCNAALGLQDSGFGTCACIGGAPWNELTGRCGCIGSPEEIQPCTGGRAGDMVRLRTCQANGSWGSWGGWDESGCTCSAGLGWDGSSCTCLGESTETETQACASGVGQQTRERSRVCTATGWGSWGSWSGWDTSTCGCAGEATQFQSCSGGRDGQEMRTRSCASGSWSSWSSWDASACACPSGMTWNGSVCTCSGPSYEENTRSCSVGFGTEVQSRSRTCTASGWSAWSSWSGWDASACMSCTPGATDTEVETRACPVGSNEASESRTGTRVCSGSGTWGSITWGSWSGCASTPPPAACPYPGKTTLLQSDPGCTMTTCSVTGGADAASVLPGYWVNAFAGAMGQITTVDGYGQVVGSPQSVVAWYEGLVCNPGAGANCQEVTSYFCAGGVTPGCDDGRTGICDLNCVPEVGTCSGGRVGNMTRQVCNGMPGAWDASGCMCPAGTSWNGSSCVNDPPVCPSNQVLNVFTNTCECPSGTTWNGSMCVTVSAGPTCAEQLQGVPFNSGQTQIQVVEYLPWDTCFWLTGSTGWDCVTADVGSYTCMYNTVNGWEDMSATTAAPRWMSHQCGGTGWLSEFNLC